MPEPTYTIGNYLSTFASLKRRFEMLQNLERVLGPKDIEQLALKINRQSESFQIADGELIKLIKDLRSETYAKLRDLQAAIAAVKLEKPLNLVDGSIIYPGSSGPVEINDMPEAGETPT